MRASFRLVAVAILIVVGAACGSSSKGASGSSTTNASGSTSSTAPTSPNATPTTQKVSGNSGSDFCNLARTQSSAFNGPNPSATTQLDLKKTYENLLPALQHIVAIAPSQIKGDFQTFVTAYTPYIRALAAANYDFTKLNFASLQGLSAPDVKAASQHIEAYLTQVCHLTTPTT